MLLMIDNYDSFTYNLVQYLGELGQHVLVYRNDALGVDDIEKIDPEFIVISPGPCTPNEAGISLEVVRRFAGQISILGVCLGHQCIGQAFGGKVVQAPDIMHGKTSMIRHDGTGIFAGTENPFEATRYHSLVIDSATVPGCLEVNAWSDEDDSGEPQIMAVRHRSLQVFGLQFHPESILTRPGHRLLQNFLRCRENRGANSAQAAMA